MRSGCRDDGGGRWADGMKAPIAIIGAGLIGQSWAIAFARGGHPVALHDCDPAAAATAVAQIPEALATLADIGYARRTVRGGDRRSHPCLEERLDAALDGAVHVQENTTEDVETKREVFAALDAAAGPDAILASSTSAILPSRFTDGLPGVARCLVAHPLNPPHLIPAVELVPAPDTASETVVAHSSPLMHGIGQSPIEATAETPGFVMNRLQGAVLDEAFSLVERGLATPGDIDVAMRDGLARRWAFVGPFETIDLNAPGGVADFMDRYAAAYAEIGRDRPTRPDWSGPLRERIVSEAHPPERRAERSRWRDGRLVALARLLAEPPEGPA